jgi:hypothetical protein
MYRPQGDVTSVQIALYNGLVEALDDKWRSKGYNGDKKFVPTPCKLDSFQEQFSSFF